MTNLLLGAAQVSAKPLSIAVALRASGLDAIDARVLLQHALGASHAELAGHGERLLTDAERERYEELADRRRRGEPIAYLIGWREFYGRRFGVDRSVLIPRPESELLIELALQRLNDRPRATVLDLGTGSGNLATTILLERPDVAVVATDTSAAAIARARLNAQSLRVEGIEFRQGDGFAPVTGDRFDLILSNPPYVAEGDPHLNAGDLRFEPRTALLGGPDGLACVRMLVAQAPDHLRAGGWLLFEHGYDQGEACAEMLRQAGYAGVFTDRDLAGMPRVSGGRVR